MAIEGMSIPPTANASVNVRTSLPAGFLDCPAQKLHTLLPGPTLIHLEGECSESLFVSVLLHGNETTGLSAIQKVLKKIEDRNTKLTRGLILFIGNIHAARYGARRLSQQPDFNRIWAGGELDEHRMAQTVLDYVAQSRPVAAIDIHNNTGRNPLYACINHVDRRFVQFARRFSETLVFFSEPHQVIANNLARYCVSVTLECGQSGDPEGIERACNLIEFALLEEQIYTDGSAFDEVKVFHTVARITVPQELNICFGDGKSGNNDTDADLKFAGDFDSLNFRVLSPGFKLGEYQSETARLQIHNDAGQELGDNYLAYNNGNIEVKKMFLPSMLTLDLRVIRQDCLGYIMEPYPL
ncbi:MAG TPA: succinylglutamate desuccinylase [Spongiibacteraceae bacterium]|nr:succinylglutamate desuccinylase [Spongiibacteraceae bacterium]HCS27047.1 succinylglutamate desuccinylase [Spongiibacteraceae bacterium]